MDTREYGLVLAGGGTKGAYQVGVWKALKELGIKVKAIAGASIGTLNGALILQDNIEIMEEIYNNIQINNIMKLTRELDSNKNIFSLYNILNVATDFTIQRGIENLPLRELIEKYIDIDKIYNSEIDFGLITYSVKTRTPLQVFKKDIPKDEMVNYLLASSCFPIFKPQKIGDDEYFDGGLYDNIPINMLIEKGYENIIVADIAGVGFSKRVINKHVYMKMITPNRDLGGTFEFNHELIKSNIKLGYLDTMRSFNRLQGHIYYFKAEEFSKMLEKFSLQTIYGLEYSAQIYNIDKYEEYEFEEFIQKLVEEHKRAEQKYLKLKDKLHLKNILEFTNEIETIFDKGLGLCFIIDLYLDKPMSKAFKSLKGYLKDYVLAATALLEIMHYSAT